MSEGQRQDAGATFDRYASEYDAALHRGVSLSGERKEYFAEARVAWVKRCLGARGGRIATVMDYGCGTGSGIPYLTAAFAPRAMVGVDVSEASLAGARRTYGSPDVLLIRPGEGPEPGTVDLVYSNGTFHHIPPADRPAVMAYLSRSLAPGGWLAIWENNPWNPGTRMVMRRIPFDRDAIPVPAPALRRLIQRAGFIPVRTDFLFIFPKSLRMFRALEPALSRLPLGAQYMVLARKPFAPALPDQPS